ncbi:transferase family protein [Durotheca rogersii]|uniref:transferase family protein n=1 Tax=Durotheca rogersii TaxID=419775 RepID=UPI002220E727|nr:transferase family protein [Durotheca rogersii]KAI5861429.1 transferase family protein [Durotheca rogersii]
MGESPCRVRHTRRVFPTRAADQPTTTKLSILDASVARFATCGAIWLYDAAPGADARDPAVFSRLEEALRQTLDDYPHYAGQLRWATAELAAGDANPRHVGRPVVVYGAAGDPGVELVLAEHARELSAVAPSRAERLAAKQIWRATDFPQEDLLPATKLAFADLAEYEGRPGVAVQLTVFKCGGFAVSINLAHCLSDAVCLMHFAHSWAARSRLLFAEHQPPSPRLDEGVGLPSLFDPSQLDQHANLTAPAAVPDPEKVAKARALPMHRYDWWAEDAPGYPSWAAATTAATKPPADELARQELTPSTFPPWPTWDMGAPVEHVQIRFTAAAIASMKRAAEASLPEPLAAEPISRLDAVLAHVWILINRARQLADVGEAVYLDVTLGLRGRVAPALPASFVGSPILLAYVAETGAAVCAATLGAVAGRIRATTALFTPAAVAAHLHDAAHEASPQRLWQAFLGSRHTLVTSWVRARAYEVDFVGGGVGDPQRRLARYVQGVMPRMDGLVQVMDVADTGDFDVSVCLQRETMRRLIRDPVLTAYGVLTMDKRINDW